MSRTSSHPRSLATAFGAAAFLAGPSLGPLLAQGQGTERTRVVFSMDWQGPNQGMQTSSGVLARESDLLTPFGGLPSFGAEFPELYLTGADLGLPRYALCNPQPGTACLVEVDAFSSGTDRRLSQLGQFEATLYFTTDEYAQGIPGAGNVNQLAQEAPEGDISADVFARIFQGPGPFPPPMGVPLIANVDTFDGDGEPSTSGLVLRGLGLAEPNRPGQGLPNQNNDTGDNIDAFDVDAPNVPGQVFFSLDSGFFDPEVGLNNTNSAQQNLGVGGASVLTINVTVGGLPQVYAQAGALGLSDALDDLDALILTENGVPGYQPSFLPYDWETGVSDMLLFSVRRGSGIVGQIDSILGLPIEPGDILTTPLGGPDPGVTPGILIAAENLGLVTTRAGGLAGADISGADLEGEPPYHDCNGNNVEDAVDIASGASCDDNANGIPDECESPGGSVCDCPLASSPCGNEGLGSGCANSTGGGAVLAGTGSSSIFADDLELTITGLPVSQFGIFYMGPSQIMVPFGDGLRCIGAGGVGVFRYGIQSSGPGGTISLGPGIVADSCGGMFGVAGCILLGSTWNFQGWYRDPTGPCGSAFNLSNAWQLTFTD